MRPSKALEANRERVEEVLGRYGVSNPRVFGSVARGEDDEASDLDLMVDAGAETTLFDLARLQSELESLLGCKVDVTTPDGLSSEVLKSAAPDFRPLNQNNQVAEGVRTTKMGSGKPTSDRHALYPEDLTEDEMGRIRTASVDTDTPYTLDDLPDTEKHPTDRGPGIN